MADITMCVGTDCKLRETCYRYTAEVNPYRQSFADFTNNLTCKDGVYECEDYVTNERKK